VSALSKGKAIALSRRMQLLLGCLRSSSLDCSHPVPVQNLHFRCNKQLHRPRRSDSSICDERALRQCLVCMSRSHHCFVLTSRREMPSAALAHTSAVTANHPDRAMIAARCTAPRAHPLASVCLTHPDVLIAPRRRALACTRREESVAVQVPCSQRKPCNNSVFKLAPELNGVARLAVTWAVAAVASADRDVLLHCSLGCGHDCHANCIVADWLAHRTR
jgi:hypothetical protein